MKNHSTMELTEDHQEALQWFATRAGQVVGWPGPIGDMFLVNKAKGIQKPKGLKYAISVRQSLSGPYEDTVKRLDDGSWTIRYAQEGTNPAYFTNQALQACMRDKVLVGVVMQVSEKPNSRYLILGLGQVVGFDDGIFAIDEIRLDLENQE